MQHKLCVKLETAFLAVFANVLFGHLEKRTEALSSSSVQHGLVTHFHVPHSFNYRVSLPLALLGKI